MNGRDLTRGLIATAVWLVVAGFSFGYSGFFGAVFFVLGLMWAGNVFLGGDFNDSPLDVVGRLKDRQR